MKRGSRGRWLCAGVCISAMFAGCELGSEASQVNALTEDGLEQCMACALPALECRANVREATPSDEQPSYHACQSAFDSCKHQQGAPTACTIEEAVCQACVDDALSCRILLSEGGATLNAAACDAQFEACKAREGLGGECEVAAKLCGNCSDQAIYCHQSGGDQAGCRVEFDACRQAVGLDDSCSFDTAACGVCTEAGRACRASGWDAGDCAPDFDGCRQLFGLAASCSLCTLCVDDFVSCRAQGGTDDSCQGAFDLCVLEVGAGDGCLPPINPQP